MEHNLQQQQSPEKAEQNYHDQENQAYDQQEEPIEYGNSVNAALTDQRVSRKRAQEDVKLLANRIMLLKMEEQKAWKKIEETKKKATDVLHVRHRNAETNTKKQEAQNRRDQEERALRDRNNQMSNQAKHAIAYQKEAVRSNHENEALRLKMERQQHEEVIQMQKRFEEQKNQAIKSLVRSQKDEQRQLRDQDYAFKKQQKRADLIRRINEENEKRMQIEAEVARLESEEAEWIKKLQNTNQVQAAASSELLVALNGDPDQFGNVKVGKQ